MKTIQILEKKGQMQSNGFDHVFSFSSNKADSFPHHYINQMDFDSIYNEIYSKLCNVLEHNLFKEQFTYQGVYLLWCFKKELFFYIFSMMMRHETFKQVMIKNSNGQFFLTDSKNSHKVCLANIVKASPLNDPSRIFFKENPSESTLTAEESIKRKNSIWPSVCSIGNLKKTEVVIFSNFERSKSVISHLRTKPVIFLNCPSPRIILQAVKNSLPFFQAVFHFKRKDTYQLTAESFSKILNETRVFENFSIREVHCEALLNWKMNDLFRVHLPKLLFEIDKMTDFFNRAKSLKSALLDEDIDASKNAFCQVARKFGVVSFVELHGALGDKHGFMPFTADKMFVWGNAQKEKLIGWGCPSEKILVSGCSRYDSYQRLNSEKIKKKVAKDLGLDSKEKMVVLAFMPVSRWYAYFEAHMEEIISETIEVVSEFSHEARFVIKLHPADENIDFYRSCIKHHKIENRVSIIQKYDPLLLAKAAHFLIIYRSTYAIDAFALDKPVICLYDRDDDLISEYRQFSVFQYASDKNTLRKMCERLLREPFRWPDRWADAKIQCLNDGVPPGALIAHQLLSA